MNFNDAINGTYELLGGILLLLNCYKLHKDKKVRGVTLTTATFFATWSWWNLYYYPSLNQWFSFTGGLLIGLANATWLIMATYYTQKEKDASEPIDYEKKWAEAVRDINAIDGCWEKKLEAAEKRIKELEYENRHR